VIGSNICNIVLILGLASLIRPLVVHLQVLKTDLPILVMVTIVVSGFVYLGSLPRWAGALFLAGITTYTLVTIHLARKEQVEDVVHQEYGAVVDPTPPALAVLLVLVVSGSSLLVFGSDMMLKGAVTIAETWGVSEAVIGLTLVAVGGSLPELATSIVAALKGNGDIAVGNVVGSNIFNLLCVLGAAALASPLVVTGISIVDLVMLNAVTILVIPLMYTGFKISRVEGGVMLFAYVGYVIYLFIGR
jgi:cation:H+ antiporter